MPNIKLIVTGEMERLALHHSLSNQFPHQTKSGEPIIWETPHCLPGATSARLKGGDKIWPPMEKLANALLAEVKGGKNGGRPDLVLLIDDLELHNLDQQTLVAAQLCKTLVHLLTTHKIYSAQAPLLRQLLRERCSFHILKPLPEAYFFGDPLALGQLGVATAKPKLLSPQQKEEIAQHGMQSHPPKLVTGQDLEHFETDDPEYLPICAAINQKQQARYDYWREQCHPKHYLKYLQPYYEETKQGARALEKLNWPKLSDNRQHLQSVRALFADLASWFDVANPLPGIADPDYSKNRPENILRNL